MIHVLFAEGLVRLGPARGMRGLDELRATRRARARPSAPRAATGIARRATSASSRARSPTTPRAVLYGRVGVCTQEFGGLAAWLVLRDQRADRPPRRAGRPDVHDAGGRSACRSRAGSASTAGSRAGAAACRGLPEFGGELPVAALAEEIETPGDGQIRALITSAGNPVLSTPNGAAPRARARSGSTSWSSIDPYLNETTRHAHVILPPTSPLERSHYDLALAAFAVRNVAKYSPPVFERAARRAPRLGDLRSSCSRACSVPARRQAARASARSASSGPRRCSTVALRLHGPHKAARSRSCAPRRTASISAPLEPRLPERLGTRDKAHRARAARCTSRDLPRLERGSRARRRRLVLIGRRHLRSNNSWMHNSERLVKGPPRCTLLIHPDDAARARPRDGATARASRPRAARSSCRSRSPTTMMPGVVSLPHGWGHDREGVRLARRATRAGREHQRRHRSGTHRRAVGHERADRASRSRSRAGMRCPTCSTRSARRSCAR